MADITPWLHVRRIPPSRSRTPLIEVTEPDQELRSSTRPPTPKKGFRPKLSSYLSQSGPFGAAAKPEPDPVFAETPSDSFPSWAVEDTFPNPSAGQFVDTILCRLMSEPYEALDPRFNGALLQIFEAYRHLTDQQAVLEKQISEESDARSIDRSAMQQAEAKWEEEKQTYKAEVKRLELVIAKGKRGVAEVALVRQDSLVRRRQQMTTPDDEDDGKETVFEFLEKTKRFEDPSWSSQRGRFIRITSWSIILICGSDHETSTRIPFSSDGKVVQETHKEDLENEHFGGSTLWHSTAAYARYLSTPGIVSGGSSGECEEDSPGSVATKE